MKFRIMNKDFSLIYFIIIIMVLSYFELPFLNSIGIFNFIYKIGKLLSCLLFAIILIINKKCKLKKYIVIFVFYELLLFFRSLYLGLPIVYVMTQVASEITFIVFADYFLEYYFRQFTNVLFAFILIIVTINFVLMLKYKYGIYNIGESNRAYWLLGHVNNMPVYIFPAIFISFNKYKNSNKIIKILSLILLCTSFISVIYGKSATSIIGLLIIIFHLTFKKFKLNLIHYYLISLVIFIFIVILGREYKLMSFISMFFNRSITFTGRTNIWNHALYYIKEKLILGYGLETPLVTMAKFDFITPHNRYLYILYTGGVLGFALFTYFVFSIWRLSISTYKNYSNDIIYRSLYYTCCAIFIIFQMETYAGVLIYFPFLLLANMNIRTRDMLVE
ncbi:MAG: O-antigen ligase family protein [Finegoldia magna]|uniref:O-antigen ligase family protein n=1 Tax=Finegoldia magna TaxID=1260 RepID=A0A943QNS7_FINMA|nr:O-antigen ligase family protein [Finegoldia magna]MBS5964986.1 O-antigen ligase family protein [Finegoldia magna]